MEIAFGGIIGALVTVSLAFFTIRSRNGNGAGSDKLDHITTQIEAVRNEITRVATILDERLPKGRG